MRLAGGLRGTVAIGALWCGLPLLSQTTAAVPEAVNLLRTNCSPCHSRQNRSSGLSMDSREEVLQGGNRGPAIKAGAPGESLVVQAIEQRGDLKMPPGRRLSEAQIAIVRTWIEQGMTWPEQSSAPKRVGSPGTELEFAL